MSLRPSESDTLYYELMALYNASRERERELTAEVERLRVQPDPSLLGRETVREALEREEKYLHALIDDEDVGSVMHGDIEGAFHRLQTSLSPLKE